MEFHRDFRWVKTVNLDLDLVRTFLSVIDQGGFTRAASRLHKTQSTISFHIAVFPSPGEGPCGCHLYWPSPDSMWKPFDVINHLPSM
jgi:Bacterial regulatory helix-turn-helix protein, lysR family